MKTEELSTTRLLLRSWRVEDAPALYALASDPKVGAAAGWPPHRSEAESLEVIRTVFAAPETYAVVLRADGRPVGCVGLLDAAHSHFPIGASDAEVGYWLGVPWWGQGLMTEALGALVRRAFLTLGRDTLWGGRFRENTASRRVMEKCGFRPVRDGVVLDRDADGRERFGEILSLTRTAWYAAQGVEVRRVSEEAVGQIRAVAAVAFPATYCELLTPAQLDYMMEWMYSEESLRAQFRGGHVWFMAFAGGIPCGYVSVERQGEALFHLQKIYVLPDCQGLGIGARLFRQAVAHVRAEHPGRSLMELNVNRHNPALHFYERMGMRRLREGDFPIGGGFYMNDYIMGLDIE